MRNTIQLELKLAKSMMIEEFAFRNHKMAKLTRENVAKAEAMIRNDSAYIRSSDINAAPNEKYGGSTAYWMTQLKGVLIDGQENKLYSYEEIIKGAVEAVDRENSTHLNSDNCGRQEITERICRFECNELIKCLKAPEYKDMLLIREISRVTSAKKRARTNISFASKFCHYACFYLFEGTEFQDNYPIYDRILKTVLVWYLDYYSIDHFDLRTYKGYREAVDSVIFASRGNISRNGFDHLLWYFHKGRM